MTGARVAVVAALWDPDRTADVLRRLRDLYGDGRPLTIVGVANSRASEEAARGLTDVLVSGSNLDAEFSAYDEGLRTLRERAVRTDALVLANDRAFSYAAPPAGTDRILRHVVGHRLAAGHVDALPHPMTVLGERVHAYLRSNHLVLPYEALPPDFAVTSVPAGRFDALVPVDYPGAWSLGALCAPEYADFLGDWLTRQSGPDRWYRAAPLDDRSWPVLRAKLKSIVNEHLLSARLRRADLTLVSPRTAASTLVASHAGRLFVRRVRPDRLQRVLRGVG